MSLSRLGFILVPVLAAGLGYVFWQSLPQGDVDFAPAPGIDLAAADQAMLQRGREVYQAHCLACHGAQLEGQPNWRERRVDGRLPAPPHDASGHTWHHPDAQLFALTKYGIGPVAGIPDYPSDMPAYNGILSDADIVAVLSWIKSQWPPEVRAHHDRINQQAAEATR